MPKEYYLLILLLLAAVIGMAFWLSKKISEVKEQIKPDNTLLEWTKSTQESINSLNKSLNDALRSTNQNINQTLIQNTKHLNDRLDKAAQVIGTVSKEIGEMSEIG